MGAVVLGARRLASAASEAVGGCSALWCYSAYIVFCAKRLERPSEAVGGHFLFNFKASKLIEGSIFQWSNSNTKLLSDL